MTEFLAELRRRHIFRIGAGYVVVAWTIAQVVDVLSQTFALPDWIAQPILSVLVLGFLITLIASWMIVGAAKAGETPAELKKATTTDWVLTGALAVVIILIGFQRFFLMPSETRLASNPQDDAAAITGDIVQEISERLPNSIAVLPFENLSPDPDDAYFAAGIHDELLNKLSKIQSLAVIARGSVMRYAGTDLPISQIAQELNIEMVMTGTVRYAGDQVRVTAELIDGMTNLPIWTTEDDGDISDIFAIQTDIAMSIANSLQAEFSAAEQESIELIPTDSAEAYTLYLRALALAHAGFRGAGASDERAAIQSLLDQAIRLDPEFAMAHAWKAYVYASSKQFDLVAEEDQPAFGSEMDSLIVENANTALAIDPDIGLAHAALAQMYFFNGEHETALAQAEDALRLSPNDSDAVALAARALVEFERGTEAIALLQRAAERDPNNLLVHRFLADGYLVALRFDEAAMEYRKCLELGASTACANGLAGAEIGGGNTEAALDAVRFADQLTNATGAPNNTAVVAYFYGRLGLPNEAQRKAQQFSEIASTAYVNPVLWALVNIGVGGYDAAYDVIVQNLDIAREVSNIRVAIQLNATHDPVLEEPRWVELRSQLARQ